MNHRCAAFLGSLLLVSASLGSSGCEKGPPASKLSVADQTYIVRARIIELPDRATRTALQVHHEVIPSFVGKTGEVTGMKEMIMEFPTVGLQAMPPDLAVNDAVEMTFEVRWKSDPRTLVTLIRQLPAETVLNLKAVSGPS